MLTKQNSSLPIVVFTTKNLPFLSRVTFVTSLHKEGLKRIITPLLCFEPCAKKISPPHSARQNASKLASLYVSWRKITSNFLRWSHRKSFLFMNFIPERYPCTALCNTSIAFSFAIGVFIRMVCTLQLKKEKVRWKWIVNKNKSTLQLTQHKRNLH